MPLPKTAPPAPAQPLWAGNAPSLQHQTHLLIAETGRWVADNSLGILVSVGIASAIVLALLGVKSLGRRLCRAGRGGHWRTIVGRILARTGVWFCIIAAARLVEGYAKAPPAVDRTLGFLFTVSFAFQAALWMREFVLGAIEHKADQDHDSLGSALGIIRLLVSFALFAIATVLVLDNVGVNVTGLVAGLGIGGIAIGLAAQGIFADLFAAMAIIFDKPFRRGDGIQWNTTTGTVEAIGLKSTRVRAITGELVVIANRNLLDKELHNFARLDRRRNVLAIGITYQTPPETCARVPEMVRGIVEAQAKCTLVRCGMTGFGASSLDYEVQFDVHSEIYDEVFAARSAVCIAILDAFNRAGIAFAYPTTVTMTAGADGKVAAAT